MTGFRMRAKTKISAVFTLVAATAISLIPGSVRAASSLSAAPYACAQSYRESQAPSVDLAAYQIAAAQSPPGARGCNAGVADYSSRPEVQALMRAA